MKLMSKRIIILPIIFIAALSLFLLAQNFMRKPPESSDGNKEDTSSAGKEKIAAGELVLLCEEELAYAKRFTLARYEGGYSVFTIPGTGENKQYLIVPEGKEVPNNLPQNTVILQQPVTKICFASGSLASLTGALGAADSITTVAISRLVSTTAL